MSAERGMRTHPEHPEGPIPPEVLKRLKARLDKLCPNCRGKGVVGKDREGVGWPCPECRDAPGLNPEILYDLTREECRWLLSSAERLPQVEAERDALQQSLAQGLVDKAAVKLAKRLAAAETQRDEAEAKLAKVREWAERELADLERLAEEGEEIGLPIYRQRAELCSEVLGVLNDA